MSWYSIGNVWLRWRRKALFDMPFRWNESEARLAESGVNRGEEGLSRGLGEKDEVESSVKTAESEFSLRVVVRSPKPSGVSTFRLSSLRTPRRLVGDGDSSSCSSSSLDDRGESLSGDLRLESVLDIERKLVGLRVSLLDLRPGMLCRRLKFFNQTELLAGLGAELSGPETEEKYCALSRITSSDSTVPFFCSLMTQFERVFSMSGDLPFILRSGERTTSFCF